MGVWMATSFTGNLFAGWLGGLWSSLSSVAFFSLVAAIAVVAGCWIEVAQRPLRGLFPD